MRRVSLALVIVLLAAAAAHAQTRGLSPTDYYSMTFVGNTEISPTGDLVAFVVTTINEEDNKRHREIWLQRLHDGRPEGELFRFTDPTEESTNPHWSPDGTILSFTSRRGEDKNNVWFMRVTAPGGEAYHIEGVDAAPAWSPDGQWIAFTRAPKDEDEEDDEAEDRREGWIAPDAISHTLDPSRFDGRVITSRRYKRDGTQTLLPDPATRDKSQLFVVAAAGGEPRQLTDMPFNVRGIDWIPNGNAIIFGGNPLEDDEWNQENTQELYAVTVDGGDPRVLTSNPGSETGADISPNGRQLAFVWSLARDVQPDIMVVDLNADGSFAGEPRMLTGEWDLIPGSPEWTRNGRALRFVAGVGADRHLFEVSTRDGEVRQITHGDRRVGSLTTTSDGRYLAYTSTDVQHPAEFFVARADGSNEVRITSFNDTWLAEVTLMPAERLSWHVADGTEVEGWVIKPVGWESGRTYPMILKIHGGPYGAYGNTFFQTFHVLSAAGFYVLYTNPRGSTGYGHDFQFATRGAWGEVDSEDYLGGVAAAVEKYSDIDPDRVGVSGGSYGGYMTNWLTATSDRFAAAVTSRSITSWEIMYATSDAGRLMEHAFYGPPWEQRERYRAKCGGDHEGLQGRRRATCHRTGRPLPGRRAF